MSANLLTNVYFKVEHYLPDSSNSNTEGYSLDLALQAVSANLQPSSPELIALNNGAYGKGYTIFTLASGILETDRITLVSGTDNRKFIVKGKQNYNYGLGQHIELYVEEVQ